MHTGHVVHLFEGKRSKRSQTAGGKTPTIVARAWKRITSIAATAVEVARESRELERDLLKQRGHHRFLDS